MTRRGEVRGQYGESLTPRSRRTRAAAKTRAAGRRVRRHAMRWYLASPTARRASVSRATTIESSRRRSLSSRPQVPWSRLLFRWWIVDRSQRLSYANSSSAAAGHLKTFGDMSRWSCIGGPGSCYQPTAARTSAATSWIGRPVVSTSASATLARSRIAVSSGALARCHASPSASLRCRSRRRSAKT